MSGFQHYDQSGWTAMRAAEAVVLGPPANPVRVTLPGAKVSISHDDLGRYQARGLGEREIVERINTEWHEANADHLAAHGRWVKDSYLEAIERMKEITAEANAEELRRRAIFEEIIRSRGAE